MALRARLSPPREEQSNWPWHKAKSLSLPISALLAGERRMEADGYLSGGYGLKLAFLDKLGAEERLGTYARVWQPSRLKGIVVDQASGTPFLAATQVFDQRPVSRKYLSLNKTEDASQRFIEAGVIMLTCSGTVGRATLATNAIKGVLISHDLLRIEAAESSARGWIYAFLRSSTGRQMMTSAQYGHMIKHLEPSHLNSLPMPRPVTSLADEFESITTKVLQQRNTAHEMFEEAENLFGQFVGAPRIEKQTSVGFSVASSRLFAGRRRFEGVFHNQVTQSLYEHFAKRKFVTESIHSMGLDCWLPGRFQRIPAEEGVPLVNGGQEARLFGGEDAVLH